MKVSFTFDFATCVPLDAYGGGFVEANPKNFYFVDKKCRTPCQCTIDYEDQTVGTFGFWYQNEETRYKDFIYQLYWHLNIVNIPISHDISCDSEMFAEYIKDYFENELSVKISKQRSKDYVDFFVMNGFLDFEINRCIIDSIEYKTNEFITSEYEKVMEYDCE
jgi:hypothetical protein